MSKTLRWLGPAGAPLCAAGLCAWNGSLLARTVFCQGRLWKLPTPSCSARRGGEGRELFSQGKRVGEEPRGGASPCRAQRVTLAVREPNSVLHPRPYRRRVESGCGARPRIPRGDGDGLAWVWARSRAFEDLGLASSWGASQQVLGEVGRAAVNSCKGSHLNKREKGTWMVMALLSETASSLNLKSPALFRGEGLNCFAGRVATPLHVSLWPQ
ncbi:PREDICTED: uncharacterized protein LOC108538291 [Rhinopithecus bieti]|uniref:uncharacterized protein LOC108538291 n=1 Tax=Rhinopithecus bieti TaxID=61621 RepID=UPI00083BCE00|nr:PREDICTED: uncharacterized protein LOC108538291 [Rhinopithecus bieti]